MSVANEINRIKTNIANAYTKAEEKGATLPTEKNSANLADTIASITAGGGTDISDTTATANTVLEGKVFYNADGERTIGTLIIESEGIEIELPSAFAICTDVYYFKFNDDTYLISGTSNNIGVWEYKISTRTFLQLYSAGSNWQSFQVIGNKCLIGGPSGATGILVYNSVAHTVIQSYSSGYKWEYLQVVGDKCLISSSMSALTGILLYNSNDDTITKVYTSGYNWRYFGVVGNKCLISNSSSTYSGIYLYNSIDDTITQIYSLGGVWQYFSIVEDKCLISSSRTREDISSGILVYNSVDDTISKKYTGGAGWQCCHKVGDKYLLSSRVKNTSVGTYNTLGVLLYNPTDDTFARKYSGGYNYDIFENNYLSSSKEDVPNKLYYNPDDLTVNLVGYHIP